MLLFNYKRCPFYFIFRLRPQNNSQEAILRVPQGENFDPKRYDRAIDMFLNEYPDGELRLVNVVYLDMLVMCVQTDRKKPL